MSSPVRTRPVLGRTGFCPPLKERICQAEGRRRIAWSLFLFWFLFGAVLGAMGQSPPQGTVSGELADFEVRGICEQLASPNREVQLDALRQLTTTPLAIDLGVETASRLELLLGALAENPEDEPRGRAILGLIALGVIHPRGETSDGCRLRRLRIWQRIEPELRRQLENPETYPIALKLYFEFDGLNPVIVPALLAHLKNNRLSSELFGALQVLRPAAAEPMLRNLLRDPVYGAEAREVLFAGEERLQRGRLASKHGTVRSRSSVACYR